MKTMFLILIGLLALDTSSAQIQVLSQDLEGFNSLAGCPPITLDFDTINAGTDVTGQTHCGITLPLLVGSSAALSVVDASQTFTPGGFSGVVDLETNKLPATSGSHVLSPGGEVLGPGPDDAVENDDLVLVFDPPVSAIGFDYLSQSADGTSFAQATILDAAGTPLLSTPVPISNLGLGGPGHADFFGIVSESANIAQVVIDETDSNDIFPDSNMGIDSIRYYYKTLGLKASANELDVGETVNLSVYGGNPGELLLIAILDEETGACIPLLFAVFGADGNWTQDLPLPANLGGISFCIQAFGFSRSAALVGSNVEAVSIQ